MEDSIIGGAETGAAIAVGKKVITGEIFEDDIVDTVADVAIAAIGGGIMGTVMEEVFDIFD